MNPSKTLIVLFLIYNAMEVIKKYSKFVEAWLNDATGGSILSRAQVNFLDKEDLEDYFLEITDMYNGTQDLNATDYPKIRIEDKKSTERGYKQYFIKVTITVSLKKSSDEDKEIFKSQLGYLSGPNRKLHTLKALTYGIEFLFFETIAKAIITIDNAQLIKND
jgi:hypothetical protein